MSRDDDMFVKQLGLRDLAANDPKIRELTDWHTTIASSLPPTVISKVMIAIDYTQVPQPVITGEASHLNQSTRYNDDYDNEGYNELIRRYHEDDEARPPFLITIRDGKRIKSIIIDRNLLLRL